MIEKLVSNIEKVIVGKAFCVEKLMIALLCKGHVLIEDVPGVGKTTIAQALAKSLDCSFSRIQFTPDLMPSDIIGMSIYNPRKVEFEFNRGPIHNQIILADEINRTSPKTQSSLLEVMQEQQITVDGYTHKMEDPFMVIATQNPIEYEGTFPLPEAQLDRFLLKISMGYPSLEEEIEMLVKQRNSFYLSEIQPILSIAEIKKARDEVDRVYMSRELQEYLISIIRGTRENEHIQLGCSPRAALGLYTSSKAYAYIKNRSYVLPDDIKNLAVNVLSHRLIVKPESKYSGLSSEILISNIVNRIKVPVGDYNGYA